MGGNGAINAGDAAFFEIDTVGLFGIRRSGFEILWRTDQKVQFTYVWFKPVGRWTFKGFADVWGMGSEWTVLIEPQAWYRVSKHIDLGSRGRDFAQLHRQGLGYSAHNRRSV